MTTSLRPPERQIRADFDDETIIVYQAYSAEIAIPAAANNTFAGTPFSLNRMTWVKPSFLWMMYRSGWATKPGQEHVLAIQMTREGFDEALSLACLSHFDQATHSDADSWKQRLEGSPVRVQWDPERNIALEPQPWRAIQIGLTGEATRRFSTEWIVEITDITASVLEHRRHLTAGNLRFVTADLPIEDPYPVSAKLKAIIGAS